MSLLVSVLVVIWDILVKILEGPPTVKVVPKVVELLDLLLGGIGVAKGRDGMRLGEASLRPENLAPELIVVALLELLLGGGVDISLLINRIILAALDGVKEDLSGLLDTFKELVVLSATLGSLLVGVVLEDLLAVGLLDLVLSSLVTVLGDTKNLVVVLSL